MISRIDGIFMGCFCENRDGFNLEKKKEKQCINQIIEVNIVNLDILVERREKIQRSTMTQEFVHL